MDVPALLRQVADSVHAGRAFGPAYEADGCTVIPVAYVVSGGGAGSSKWEEPAPASSPRVGLGGGFGYVCWPVGAYVVKGGDARFVPAWDTAYVVVIGAFLVRGVIRAIARR